MLEIQEIIGQGADICVLVQFILVPKANVDSREVIGLADNPENQPILGGDHTGGRALMASIGGVVV